MKDQLNTWDFCNPNYYLDKLPEPYRQLQNLAQIFMNKIIQKDILKCFQLRNIGQNQIMKGLQECCLFKEFLTFQIFQLQAQTVLQRNIFNFRYEQENKNLQKEVRQKRINKVCLGIREGAACDQKKCLDNRSCHPFRSSSTYIQIQAQQISLAISRSGIAIVQDAEQEVRLYDVWKGEKITKLTPIQVMDDQQRQWCHQKVILQCFRNEILISAQIVTQDKQNCQDSNQTTLQIFQIFDSLVNLFPSLSNVYRKGVEKDKILNLFEKILKQELWNAQFKVPNISDSHQNVALRVPGQDSKNKTGSQVINSSLYQFLITRKLNQSKASQQKLKKGMKDSQMTNQQQEIYDNRSASLQSSQHKSVHSEKFDYNSSFSSTNSPQNHLNSGKILKGRFIQQGLTKEMLHPEEHLLVKSESQLTYLIFENSSKVDHCRLRNSEKQLRSEKVIQSLLKLGQKLAIEEEKMKLQIRSRQLQKLSDSFRVFFNQIILANLNQIAARYNNLINFTYNNVQLFDTFYQNSVQFKQLELLHIQFLLDLLSNSFKIMLNNRLIILFSLFLNYIFT